MMLKIRDNLGTSSLKPKFIASNKKSIINNLMSIEILHVAILL